MEKIDLDDPERWDRRILAVVPSGVDITQIQENLRLTPTEQDLLDLSTIAAIRAGQNP